MDEEWNESQECEEEEHSTTTPALLPLTPATVITVPPVSFKMLHFEHP